MNDPTDARSKAEASHRLAELAKTPRARELFRQLAEEYESRARGEPVELIQQAGAVDRAAHVGRQPAPDEASADGRATVHRAGCPAAPPMAETQQWLTNLAAVREES